MAGKIDFLINQIIETTMGDDIALRANIERRQKEPLLTGVTKPELLWQGDPAAIQKVVESILRKKSPKLTPAEVDFVCCGAFRLCQTCLHFKNSSKEADGQCLFRQSESDDHIEKDPIQNFRVRADGYCDGWKTRKASWKSTREMPDLPDVLNINYGMANTKPCRNNQGVIDGRPWTSKEKDTRATGYLNNAITRTCATCRFFGFPNICRIVEAPVNLLSFCHLHKEVVAVDTHPITDPHSMGNTERIGPSGEFAWTEEESKKKLAGTGE